MADFRYHDEDAGFLGNRVEFIGHLHFSREGGERGGEGVEGCGVAEVDAHEEGFGDGVGELLEVEDGEGLGGEEGGYGVDDSGFVGAGEGEEVVVAFWGGHCGSGEVGEGFGGGGESVDGVSLEGIDFKS